MSDHFIIRKRKREKKDKETEETEWELINKIK